MSSYFFQPQYARLLVSIWHIVVSCPHMQTAWYAARLICWMRAACVVGAGEGGGGRVTWPVFGGTRNIIHNDYKLLQNILIVFAKYWWVLTSLLKTVDTSGHAFHVCHAVFSPLPWYADTTSQPVNAWMNRRHIDFSRPIEGLLSFMRIHFFCSWPNATHSFSTPRSRRINRALTEMTRTSVSLALFIIVLLPSAAVCFECRKMCVSALSWLQWVSPSRLIEWLQTTPSSWVTITVLLVLGHIFTILSARKLYSSVLLLLSLKKICQFSLYQSLCV